MPPPHPRSCRDCAKAKRRCDLEFPCYRCRVRSLQCIYEERRGSKPASNTAENENTSTVPRRNLTSINDADLPDFHLDCEPSEISTNSTMGASLTGSRLPAFPDYDLDWEEVMENIDYFAVPDQLGVDNTAPTRSVLAGEIYQERIISAVKQFKAWPGMFAIHGHIPFIHARLFEEHIPLVMQEALGVCSLYAQKNRDNDNMVQKCIIQAARRLSKENCKFDEGPIMEQLASVQALCLYQIIQLFDGDIMLRSQAEAMGSDLDRRLRQLACYAKPVNNALQNAAHLRSIHEGWQQWIFDECVRRTLIVGFSIEGLYSFLKHGWDASHHDFAELGFYAQRALWTAPSEFFWQEALQVHLALPVRFPTWDSDTSQAQPSDMEELGMIMMGFIKGVDHCRFWLGRDALHKFGLSLHELGSCT